ncbi:MAG: hypothetical protein AAF441_12425 [Pseudomonadota bacterium]
MRKLTKLTVLGLLTAGPVAAATAEDHYEYLHKKCGPSLKMKESGCDCIIKAARRDLSADELEMVVLYVKQDKPGIKKKQGELTGNQTLKARKFVEEAPRACRGK